MVWWYAKARLMRYWQTDGLIADELEELFWFGECVEAFFNNRFFRSFWDYLRRTDEDIFAFFEALLALCQGEEFF